MKPPAWSREEILEVIKLGHSRNWPPSLSEADPEVKRLSEQLRDNRRVPASAEYKSVRNTAGVVRKYGDIYSQFTWNSVKPTNGGQLTALMAEEYETDPQDFLKGS